MNDNNKSSAFGVLGIIFIVILLLCAIRIAFNGFGFTLTSCLEYMSNAPTFDISKMQILHIGGFWGVLDGLRLFLNNIISIANVGLWISNQLINCIAYIFYFLHFILYV